MPHTSFPRPAKIICCRGGTTLLEQLLQMPAWWQALSRLARSPLDRSRVGKQPKMHELLACSHPARKVCKLDTGIWWPELSLGPATSACPFLENIEEATGMLGFGRARRTKHKLSQRRLATVLQVHSVQVLRHITTFLRESATCSVFRRNH